MYQTGVLTRLYYGPEKSVYPRLMTPAEARAKLLENGFFTKWEGRYLIGGSEYQPGNPGSWTGIRFSIKLVAPGECKVEVIDFEDQTKELQPDPGIQDLPIGPQKDLAWAVEAILAELARCLDSYSVVSGPKVSLEDALECARAHPDATSERELLTRVIYMDAETEASHRDALTKLKYQVHHTGDWVTEEAILASSRDHIKLVWPQGGPPVRLNRERMVIAAPSPNAVSYGRDREPLPASVPADALRDYHWAPLAEKDAWPTVLHRVPPFNSLSTPHEMSTVLFMSAARQILEVADKWLDLVFFTTEPVDGKLTACFLGSKADVTRRPKPQWLLDLGNARERQAWTPTATLEPEQKTP